MLTKSDIDSMVIFAQHDLLQPGQSTSNEGKTDSKVHTLFVQDNSRECLDFDFSVYDEDFESILRDNDLLDAGVGRIISPEFSSFQGQASALAGDVLVGEA